LLSQTAKSYALTVWSAKAQAERLGRFYQKTIEQYNSNKSSLPSMTLIDQWSTTFIHQFLTNYHHEVF